MKKIAIITAGVLALSSLAACSTSSYDPSTRIWGSEGDRHHAPKGDNDGVEGTDQNGAPQ